MALLPDRTPAFEAYVAPARLRPAAWRLAAGCALAAVCWMAAAAALVPLVGPLIGDARALPVLVLASFAALILGLALAARLLHRRGIATLLGPGGLRWRPLLIGVCVVWGAALVFGLPGMAVMPPEQQTALGTWLRWLPLALPLVLVQVGAEELAFRGYLMQQLAARFRSPLVWLVAPSLVFGLLHWSPAAYGPNAWLVVISASAMGLILGDVTARTGNLSAPIGLHFANNVLALLVVAMPSPLSGLSLFLSGVDAGDVAALRILLVADLAATLAIYALWLFWWHRRGPGADRPEEWSTTPGSD